MQGINCVKGEIHNVLTVLRLTSRSRKSSYSLHASSTESEEVFIKELKELHENLSYYLDLNHIDATEYLDPFLRVIITPDTDANVTLTALEAVHKFLVYGHINKESPHVNEALANVSYCMTHCKFDVNRQDDAEVVYMKTLEVSLECLRCSAGSLLTDDAVCAMIQECYRVRSRGTGRLLRRYAENMLSQMVLVIFDRLCPERRHGGAGPQLVAHRADRSVNEMPIDDDDDVHYSHGHHLRPHKRQSSHELNGDHHQHSHQLVVPGSSYASPTVSSSSSAAQHSGGSAPGGDNSNMSSSSGGGGVGGAAFVTVRSSTPLIRRKRERSFDLGGTTRTLIPYGVPALLRVFKFLASSIAPKNSADQRILGLRLIRIVLETAGTEIGAFPDLVQVIHDDLCKNLLQNTQTTNLAVLSLTLRIVFDLFNSVKQHLKVQLEVFFTSIHLRIAESESSSFEQKELVMESLVEFSKEPGLIVGLYRNYDCEVRSTNLFEDLCSFLSQSCMPPRDGRLTELHILSLEGVLAVLDSISKRFCETKLDSGYHSDGRDSPSAPSTPLTPSTGSAHPPFSASVSPVPFDNEEEEKIIQSREMKKRLMLAAEHFNRDGKKCFKLLQGLKILSDPLTPESLVSFFRNTPHLDKTKIGEFIGGPKELNLATLEAYVNSFEFAPAQSDAADTPLPRIDQAMRMFLEGFRLPGEAQQIARIMEAFAKRLHEQCPGPLLSADAAYVLAYSIIMLNTDAHNDQVYKKMTKEEFFRNNRDINEGQGIPEDYLGAIYDSITANAIQLTSENIRDLGRDGSISDRRWQRLVDRSQRSGEFTTRAPRIHGREMFDQIWDSAIQIFQTYLRSDLIVTDGTFVSEDQEDDDPETRIMQKIVDGVHTFARICAVYDLNQIFNNLMIALCNILCKLIEEACDDGSGFPPSVNFGRSQRIQRLTRLVFNLVLGYGEAHVMEGWSNVLQVILWLQKAQLLPEDLVEMDDFTDTSGKPLLSVRSEFADGMGGHGANSGSSAGGGGVGSFLSSALSLLWLSSSEPSAEAQRDARGARGKSSGHAREPSTLALMPHGDLKPVTNEADDDSEGGGDSEINAAFSHASSTNRDNGNSSVDMELRSELQTLEEQLVATAQDCISACRLREMFSSTKYFRPRSLQHLVSSLVLVSAYAGKIGDGLSGGAGGDGGGGSGGAAGSSGGGGGSSIGDEGIGDIPSAVETFDREIFDEDAAVFCLERLCDIVDRNQARLDSPDLNLWQIVFSHFQFVVERFGTRDRVTFYVERVVVNMLRFAIRLPPTTETTRRMTDIFRLLTRLGESAVRNLGERISAGLLMYVQSVGDVLSTTDEWQVVFSVLFCLRNQPRTARLAFECIECIVDNYISPLNFDGCLEVLLAYAGQPRAGSQWMSIPPHRVLERMVVMHAKLEELFSSRSMQSSPLPSPTHGSTSTPEAFHVSRTDFAAAAKSQAFREKLHHIQISRSSSDTSVSSVGSSGSIEDEAHAAPPASSKGKKQALSRQRSRFWLSSTQALCSMCRDPRPDVRFKALECLQRALLTSVRIRSPSAWKTCFTGLLMPLLHDLAGLSENESSVAAPVIPEPQSPARYSQQPVQLLVDLRLKAATVVFQALLHNLKVLSVLPDFDAFWESFLGSCLTYITSSTEVISTHFSELLKNTLLVMHTSGMFEVSSKKCGKDTWELTKTTLQHSCSEMIGAVDEMLRASAAPAVGAPAPHSEALPSSVSSAEASSFHSVQPPMGPSGLQLQYPQPQRAHVQLQRMATAENQEDEEPTPSPQQQQQSQDQSQYQQPYYGEQQPQQQRPVPRPAHQSANYLQQQAHVLPQQQPQYQSPRYHGQQQQQQQQPQVYPMGFAQFPAHTTQPHLYQQQQQPQLQPYQPHAQHSSPSSLHPSPPPLISQEGVPAATSASASAGTTTGALSTANHGFQRPTPVYAQQSQPS